MLKGTVITTIAVPFLVYGSRKMKLGVERRGKR